MVTKRITISHQERLEMVGQNVYNYRDTACTTAILLELRGRERIGNAQKDSHLEKRPGLS